VFLDITHMMIGLLVFLMGSHLCCVKFKVCGAFIFLTYILFHVHEVSLCSDGSM